MKKRRALVLLSLAGLLTFTSPVLTASAAWKTTSDGIMYTQTASPGYAVGLVMIGSYYYYFNDNGIMQTGLQTIGKKLYYFNEDGIMQKGWITASDGTRYYASTNGVLSVSAWVGNYYFQADGSMATSTWIDGKWVGADGKYTGVKNNVGWVTDNGVTCYYDSNSNLVKGWLTIGTKKYYLNPTTGALQTGWFKVGSKTYYSNKKGVMQKGKWVSGKYLKKNGVMATGLKTISNNTYYFDSSGNVKTGWVKYKGVHYYFNASGIMQKSKWISKKKYYVISTGARASGFVTIKKKTYYFDPSTGVKQTGWLTVDGETYYLTSAGVLKTSTWLSSSTYYAGSTGALLKGLNAIGKKLYYFDTTTGKKLTKSLVTVGSDTYYFNKNGVAVKNKWVKIKSKYYYFQSTGIMATNTWIGSYYVDATGMRTTRSKTTGWSTTDGATFYFDSDGNMVTGWLTLDDYTYYFDESGAMVTGIQTIDSKKYYFYSNGRMATSLTIIVGATEYTIGKNGIVKSEISLTLAENTTGDKIANFALQYVGNPYVYGGISLTNGADCSGFVQTVFSNFDYTLLRVANDQMNGPTTTQIKTGYAKGVTVDLSSIQPGDLLFYGSGNYASHVAIYIGNDQIVHASNSQPYPAGGIKVSNYDYNTPIKAVRYWS